VNLALAVNILMAILGPHIAGAIVFSPNEEKGKERKGKERRRSCRGFPS
jgi:hypothetical protein